MRRKMTAAKRLSAPTRVFARKPKKIEPDDMPGKMRGGRQPGKHRKRLMGKAI